MLAGQHLDLSKMALPRSSRLGGFYASECRSKQAGRTKADVAVSLSMGGYNHHTSTPVKRAQPGKELAFRSLPGFLYQGQKITSLRPAWVKAQARTCLKTLRSEYN
jgi:hypothetical protein